MSVSEKVTGPVMTPAVQRRHGGGQRGEVAARADVEGAADRRRAGHPADGEVAERGDRGARADRRRQDDAADRVVRAANGRGLADRVRRGRALLGQADGRVREVGRAARDLRRPVAVVVQGVEAGAGRAAGVGVERLRLDRDGAARARRRVDELEHLERALADRERVGARAGQARRERARQRTVDIAGRRAAGDGADRRAGQEQAVRRARGQRARAEQQPGRAGPVPVDVMSPPAIVTPVGLRIWMPRIVRVAGISGPVVTGACDCA